MTAQTANTAQRVDILGQFIRGERNSLGDHWHASMAEEAYAALLLQVAAQAAEIERLRASAHSQMLERVKEQTMRNAAERAREEACGLLREANEWVSGYSITSEFRKRIAAFLAANGGG